MLINHDFDKNRGIRIGDDLRNAVRGTGKGGGDPELQASIERLAKEIREINEMPKTIETAPDRFERVLTSPFVPWVEVDYRDDGVGVPALPMGLTAADMLEGKGFFPGTLPIWSAGLNRWTTGALKWSVLKLSPEEIRALKDAAKMSNSGAEIDAALLGIRTAQRTPDRSPRDKTAATCFLLEAWFYYPAGVGIWAADATKGEG